MGKKRKLPNCYINLDADVMDVIRTIGSQEAMMLKDVVAASIGFLCEQAYKDIPLHEDIQRVKNVIVRRTQ